MKRIFLSIIFLLIIQLNGFTQITSAVQIQKDSVTIGEEFDIRFTVFTNNPRSIKHLDLISLDSIENLYLSQIDTSSETSYLDFEITDYGNWPVNQQQLKPALGLWQKTNSGSAISFDMKAIAWDYGYFQFEGLEVVADSLSEIRSGQADGIIVLLPQNYVHQDSLSPISEIKEIIHEPIKAEDFYLLGSIIAGILALLVGLWLYRKFRKDEPEELVEEEVIIIPAHIVAFEKLQKLKEAELWQTGEIKEYQSQLTFIIREYLENRYEISALESTTDEITRDLKKVDFDSDLKQDLNEILTMADLVKFAKAKPGQNIHEQFMNKAKELVEKTKQIEAESNE